MTTDSIGPGAVLAGRYRLDDLLAESGGARFWRATDTVLARSVAIHAVPSDDPRAPHLMEAARVSATVTDPHLLRVLDCDDDGTITWVVNEWGDGISLDLMLEQGTLPPSRAAWLAREVAEAIAAGHAQGVAHGRLNPEAVLVTHAGAVKLIGYVVDASLLTQRPHDPVYGDIDEREADVINVAGILYAALTGRWPGVAPSAVPKAPREGRRPLRPRQVRAGVPRTLDAICDRVLHKEASQHAMPIETAHEIAAALADYVGDPGLGAPVDAAGMHAEPTVSLRRDQLPGAEQDPWQRPRPSASDDPEATQLSAAPVGDIDPEATELFRRHPEGPDSLSPLQPPAETGPPPPPFPDIPERPLFASTERRVPPGSGGRERQGESTGWATSTSPGSRMTGIGTGVGSSTGTLGGGSDDTGHGTGHGTGQEFWPFAVEPEEPEGEHTGKEGRGWLRTAIVIAVLLVLVIAMAVAFNRGREDGAGAPGTDDTPAESAEQDPTPVEIAGVTDFDPQADPPEENPESTGNAIDGDRATTWTTSTYRGRPDLGGLKDGVGLMVDLGDEEEVRSLTVRFKGAPTSFEVYAAPAGVTAAPDALDQLDKVGERAEAPANATVDLDPAPTTRYLLVWLTELPQVSGGFRGEISEITVSS